jgi:uncharacterized delta-60 repeat protein
MSNRQALQHAGRLDRSFGRHGRVTAAAPVNHTEGLLIGTANPPGPEMAIGPRGEIAVASGLTLVELRSNGTPDLRFGQRGRLHVPVPKGQQLRLSAIAFDSAGRLLVAGTTSQAPPKPTSGPPGYPGPARTWAMLRRYLPNGQLDRGFGLNGTVETDFGLPPPHGLLFDGVTFNSFEYKSPALDVTGIAVDSEDRPVITGASVETVTACYSGTRSLTGAYVTRLTPAGAPDLSFGESGTHRDPTAIQAEEPKVDRRGRILYTGPISNLCGHGELEETEVVALGDDGQLEPGFGVDGRTTIDSFWPESSALDKRGRLLVLTHRSYAEWKTSRVLRLTPAGTPDPTFGRDGFAESAIPRAGELFALGIDRRGRPLLAGMRRPAPKAPLKFLLKRMTTRGKVDRSFGHNGSTSTDFRAARGVRAQEVLVDGRGRILVEGTFADSRYSRPSGIALARYLGTP